uniref:Uncharacterized protein n=1 Tax=Anopheles quadriannulatus TaxID=34691 RepID=A0A182XTN6_ANOQN
MQSGVASSSSSGERIERS